MTPKHSKTLHEITDLESVFSFIRKGQKRIDIGGLNVSIRRMECFAVHGTLCVKCKQRTGNVILVEEWPNGQIHVDLYHRDENGNKVLMNIDHILPKSRGGKNDITNYQPMCQPCNSKKGNKMTEDQQNEQAAKNLYNIIMGQEFCDWYEGDFQDHVIGEVNCKSRDEVIQDLKGFVERYKRIPN